MHIKSCKEIDSAVDKALKKHKTLTARKAEEKKAAVAAHRELAEQASQALPEDQMDVDSDRDSEVFIFIFNFKFILHLLQDISLQKRPPLRSLSLIISDSPTPPPRPSGRPNRKIRLPQRFRDILPANPPAIPLPEEPDEDNDNNQTTNSRSKSPSESSQASSESCDPFITEVNTFGIYRSYTHGPPTITPDEYFTLSSVSDSVSMARDPAESQSWSSLGPSESSLESFVEKGVNLNYFAPFLNASVFLLMAWYYNGSSIKSFGDIDKLVHNVIQHEDFKSSDFGNTFSTAREAQRMDKQQEILNKSLPFSSNDGWIEGRISIPVPCDGVEHESEELAPRFVIDGIWYRRPLAVIKRAFSEHASEKFHNIPFKEYWKPSEQEPSERIYSETFTADVFNDEYDKLRKTTRDGPNSALEPFVAGITFYSDSTHLTSFGNASLWPIYMYIGNQSKYLRAKPSEFAAHHIAYIPKVYILV